MTTRRIPRLAAAAALVAAMTLSSTQAFTTPSSLEVRTSRTNSNSNLLPHPTCTPFKSNSNSRPRSASQSTTSLNVLGSDGILGVGAPEIAVTLIVGYFVLGPSDLYKLVKEVGKFIQNFRTLGAEAAKTFEGTMEDQLELTELRKAQSELTEAFSFRRSINTDEFSEAFDKTGFAENRDGFAEAGVAAAATATTSDGSQVAVEEGTAPKKKRKLVRRRKKKPVEEIDVPSEERVMMDQYPDLDMLDVETPKADAMTTDDGAKNMDSGDDEQDKLRKERLERLSGGADTKSNEPDWFTASEEDIASEVLNQPTMDPALESYQQQRFQSQLTADDWNAQIMANEDDLAPLSMVMKRLAILEEEKNSADKLLEEEYAKRMDNEDKYYLEKRRVLEEAITDIQEGVYGGEAEAEKEGTKFTA